MKELQNKNTFTSLELTELINQFRREEGNKNELLHKNLMAVIRDEFQEEINELKIQPVEYADKKGEKRPMFILNLQQSRQVLVRESKFVRKAVIKYIDELENKLNSITTKEQYLLNILRANGDLEKTLAIKDFDDKYIKPLENNLKQTTQKLEHKQEVINVMTDEIKMKTQRQFLNEIIKMKGGNLVKDRWKLLYNNYSSMKHINLKARFEGYNRVNTPKCKSYLEYIDNIMNDISTLYGIAVKLFESDFRDKLEKYIEVL